MFRKHCQPCHQTFLNSGVMEEKWRGLGAAFKPPCPPPPGSPSGLLAPIHEALSGFHLEMRFRGRVYSPSTALVRAYACEHVYTCVYAMSVCARVYAERGIWSLPCTLPKLAFQTWSSRSEEIAPHRILRNDSSRQPPSMKSGPQVPQYVSHPVLQFVELDGGTTTSLMATLRTAELS